MAVGIQVMKTAIVGGGIIGMTTGVVLAEAGHDVTILSRDPFEKTTSHAAGAILYPINIEETERVLRWFARNNEILGTLPREAGISLVEWCKGSARETCPEPFWMKTIPSARFLTGDECSYTDRSAVYAQLLHTDVDRHYAYMAQRFKDAGGTIRIENVFSLQGLEGYNAIINCTGIYAGGLTKDDDIHPARGQIVLVRNPSITSYYATFDSRNYIYPRGALCVLGGSYDVNAWDTAPDAELTGKILAWAAAKDPRLQNAEAVDVRVGLRPMRSSVRLEKENTGGRTIIHNYGHGGCGYTIGWACAEDVLKLLEAA